MVTIKPQQNQNIFDIALQEYGSVEGIFDLLEDNNLDQVDNELSVYNDLQIVSAPTRREIKEFYFSREIHPASGVTDSDLELLEIQDKPDGIGYMIIENDFVVSENDAVAEVMINGLLSIGNIDQKMYEAIIKSISYAINETKEVIGKLIPDGIDITPGAAIPFSIPVKSDTIYAIVLNEDLIGEVIPIKGIRVTVSIAIQGERMENNLFNSTEVIQEIKQGEQFEVKVYSNTTTL